MCVSTWNLKFRSTIFPGTLDVSVERAVQTLTKIDVFVILRDNGHLIKKDVSAGSVHIPIPVVNARDRYDL